MKLLKSSYAIYFLTFFLWSTCSYSGSFPEDLAHCGVIIADVDKLKVGESVIFNNGDHFQKGVVRELRFDGTIISTIVINSNGTDVEFRPSILNSIHPYRSISHGIGSLILYRHDGSHYRKARIVDRASYGWALLDQQDHYIFEGNLRPYVRVSTLLGIKTNDAVLVEEYDQTLGSYYRKRTVTDITEVGLVEFDGTKEYIFPTNIKPYLPKASWNSLKVGDSIIFKGTHSQSGKITDIDQNGLIEINNSGIYRSP